ncbi:MAG: SDR family oxidoreductase [Labilithrix sp.]|nr:SDR family oxidoreductase [Labilithrix sp.]
MKNVLITGCSSGYGRATALQFLERGWNVVATMRSPGKAGLPKADRLREVRLDVTDRASIDAAIREGLTAFGGLDVVVNNAGIGLFGAFEATPEKTVREVFETNTFGVMAVTQAVIPHFRERRAGTLVNVTSSVGIVPMPLVAAYVASKFAIEGFTEALSYELSCFGVRTKIVQPGYGPTTSFIANSGDRMNGTVPEPYAPYAQQLMSGMGAAKTTNATEVAEAVWLAATDGSDRLRYAAGRDAEDLAVMRRALPGEDYLGQLRAAMGPKSGA